MILVRISRTVYLNMSLMIEAEFPEGRRPEAILRFAAPWEQVVYRQTPTEGAPEPTEIVPYEVVLSGERASLVRSWIESRHASQAGGN